MRLIDADAIPWTDLNSNNPNSDIKVLVTFAEKVNRMPTIEPERKKGKWMTTRPDAPMFGFYYCPLCGRKKTSPQDNFCPNCGADMRGGE